LESHSVRVYFRMYNAQSTYAYMYIDRL